MGAAISPNLSYLLAVRLAASTAILFKNIKENKKENNVSTHSIPSHLPNNQQLQYFTSRFTPMLSVPNSLVVPLNFS